MIRKTVFVSNANSLREVPGGQQICTREFLDAVRLAGFDPEVVSFQFSRKPLERLRRKLRPNPYRNCLPGDLVDRVVLALQQSKADWLFLNLTELTPIAGEVKRRLPSVKIAVLSHGAESVDYFHSLRIEAARTGRSTPWRRRRALADQLLDEAVHRPHIDHIFVLAPFEVEYERWLGAKRATWIPRQVLASPLDWHPKPGRLGFVGTLDHWPTIEGLDRLLPELATRVASSKNEVRLRMIGKPTEDGEALAAKYPFIEFLGGLNDDELVREAATWTSMLHPLFCYGRGCSTKLATSLGWRIPVVTTPAGARGYTWRQGGVTLGESPAEVASLAMELATDSSKRLAAKQEIERAADTSPTAVEVAEIFRRSLAES